MSEHTPGPWRLATADELEEANEYRPHIVAPGPLYVAAIYDSLEEYDSNARLIAAAPELYAALRAIAAECKAQDADYRYCDVSCHIKARAALAKAEGTP